MADIYIRWPASGGSSDFSTHNYYVDGVGGDDSNSGNADSPFLTIGAALSAIGSAADATAYNDASQAYYLINVAPGVYTENLSIPTRQYIQLNMSGAKLVGNITYNVLGATLLTGAISKTKLVLNASPDLRGGYTGSGYPLTGITGNIALTNTGSQQAIVSLDCFGVGGNITATTGSSGFSGLLFVRDSIIIGTISADATSQITLYASDCDTSATKSIGAVSGSVLLNVLRNVRFIGTVVCNSGSFTSARWVNVAFAAVANDFTGQTATVAMDANSYTSFVANVSSGNRSTITATYLDQAQGVGYTPTTSANWSPVPTTVLGALDTLAASTHAALTLAAVGSSPNANAATIAAGQILNLEPASASFPGVVTTGTQSFAGAKTFTGAISASNLSGTNTGDLTLAAVGSTPSANGASLSGQVLTLQPASSTLPGIMTAGAQTIGGAKILSGSLSVPKSTDSEVIGAGAGAALTSGAGNVFLGKSAGAAYTSQGSNIAIGYQALLVDDAGTNNLYIGYQAGSAASTSSNAGNTVLGSMAGQNLAGSNNVMIGRQAGVSILSSSNNVIIGASAMISVGITGGTVCVGESALHDTISTTQWNTAIGQRSMYFNTTGQGNLGLGAFSGCGKGNTASQEMWVGDVSQHATRYAINSIYVESSNTNGAVFQRAHQFAAAVGFSAASAATPGLYFDTDTTSGIYRPAANQVGIAISGSLKALFSSSGLTINSVVVGSAANTISAVSTLVNGSGTLTLPTTTDTLVGRATTDTLTNKSISGSTNTLSAIAYASLVLTTSIVNGDISTSAAIARSKLASGTNYRILANSSSGVMSENAALTAAHVIFADANGQLSGEASLAISRGGTGAATKAAGFDALSPMTTGGDLIYGGASGTGTRLANGTAGYFLKSNGTTLAPSWAALPSATVPTVQTFTTGSGTYTTPANVLYIRVRMVGGGGGGGGSGTALGSAGGTGGTSTFGTTLLSCVGGSGGAVIGGNGNTGGGAGGTASLGSGPIGSAITGGGGGGISIIGSSNAPGPGGIGGSSYLGGAGAGLGYSIAGGAGVTNTGGGGAGGPTGLTLTSASGGGGGAGGYVDAIISSPSATYSYAVGAGGSAGGAGTTGYGGGAGGSGYIEVTEYYS